jgi:methyl-accepting chemotaxis protein
VQRLKSALTCLLLASLVGLVVCACLLVRRATAVITALPAGVSAELQATRSDLVGQVKAARADLTSQVTAVRTEALSVVKESLTTADRRIGDSLGRVDRAITAVEGVRTDVQPVLAQATAILKDAQDTADDLYPDVRALVQSSDVAARSVAETMGTVEKAAPQVADSVVSISKSADAIAADVRREVDEATRPKKWWQKALGPIYTAGRLTSIFF